jgi:multiple sugar transport system permease protein
MAIGVSNLGVPDASAAPMALRPLRRRRAPVGVLVRRNVTGYAFLAGALLCFSFFSWYPMVREFVISLQKAGVDGHGTWNGLANYRHVNNDPEFWSAWRNTALFAGLALVLGFAVPFVLAVLLNELRHAKAYFRLLVYLPVMIPPAAAALLFKYFYTPDTGLFDAVLTKAHLPTLQWLDSTHTAMLSLVIFSTWINMGSGTLIYLAALQSIPGDLYEAAELDGASLVRRVWHVTMPQTRLILSLMFLLQIVATMQVFLEPYILSGGGPGNATTTVVYLMYEYAFHQGNFGNAAALGVCLLVVLAGFAAAYLRLVRRTEEE